MWTDVQDYFPDHTIINRGFGGSTLSDQIQYAKDIIIPLSPKQIVIYCGENDIAYDENLTASEVTERFITLFNLIRNQLPEATITYVSMKPSPNRWHLAEKMKSANQFMREFISSKPNSSFVDIWDKMLDENQLPDSTLFFDDMLHMNEKGYRLWQQAIKPMLVY
jgi:lysophospholipase L1-like esterase